jgi:hypothetical protein
VSAPIFAVVRFVEELDEYKWQAYAEADGGLPEVMPVAGGSFGYEELSARGELDTHEQDLLDYVAELAGVEPWSVAVLGIDGGAR